MLGIPMIIICICIEYLKAFKKIKKIKKYIKFNTLNILRKIPVNQW